MATTTTVAPKAIYVGHESVYDFLVKIRPDWQFEAHVPDIESLWAGLDSGAISSDVQVLLILDNLFDPRDPERTFESLVAQMAQHCMFGIINYHPENNEMMNERIHAEAYAFGASDIKYYYIDRTRPAPSLDAAVTRFASETDQRETALILLGQPIELESEETDNPVERGFDGMLAAEEQEESDYLGQVVAVTSSKGGSGKSTVAVSLATFLAHSSINSVREGLEEEPLKVIILDLDVRDGQLGFLTNNSSPTVVQLRLSGISDETLEKNIIHSTRLKCDLLLAPKKARNAENTPPSFYQELIQALRKKYDYIILDTSVNYLDPLLEEVAYPMADQIIFVTDIVINSVFSMTRWIQEVTKPKANMGMGIPKSKIAIVVNKVLGGVAMPGSKIHQSALNIPVITGIPSNPKIIATAANTQQMELLLQHSDIYAAVRRIARSIVGHKYKLSNNVT